MKGLGRGDAACEDWSVLEKSVEERKSYVNSVLH